MKELSLWCRYDRLGASSRLRFYQFIPALETAGFQVDAHHFFPDSYLKALYSGKGKSKTAFLSALKRRFGELSALPAERPMIVEYELLPFMPWCVERRFLKKRKYLLNFDDAVDLRYQRMPFLKNKYPELISHAAGVIVANDELLERFSQYNANILKLPTVPPPESGSAAPERGETLRIGWIGTPITYKFLQQHTGILQKMYALSPFELLVIAREELPVIPGIPTKCVNWTQETEHQLLQSCHIGIMPLDDSSFARGKSAFKLIQYLRAGIPAIASAVGENIKVIQHNRTGFCAAGEAEWLEAWQQLSQAEIRQQMSADIAVEAEKYSFERNAATLTGFINSAL